MSDPAPAADDLDGLADSVRQWVADTAASAYRAKTARMEADLKRFLRTLRPWDRPRTVIIVDVRTDHWSFTLSPWRQTRPIVYMRAAWGIWKLRRNLP